MSKGKKIYCIASFAFACAVLILTITLCMMHPGRVYASSMDPDSITKITQKDTKGAGKAKRKDIQSELGGL